MLVLVREGTNEKYELCAGKDVFQIGRQMSCDIKFKSIYVSRQHCEIKRIPPDGRLILSNKKPTTITFVDDVELRGEHAVCGLQIGSRIGLGVPLDQADENGLRNPEFVFLRVKEETPTVVDLVNDKDEEPSAEQPPSKPQGNSPKDQFDTNITHNTVKPKEESGANKKKSFQDLDRRRSMPELRHLRLQGLHSSSSSIDIRTEGNQQEICRQESLPLQLESPVQSKHNPEVQCQGSSVNLQESSVDKVKAQQFKLPETIRKQLSLTRKQDGDITIPPMHKTCEKSSSLSQTPDSDKLKSSVLHSSGDERTASLDEIDKNNGTFCEPSYDEKCALNSKPPLHDPYPDIRQDLKDTKCKYLPEKVTPVNSVCSPREQNKPSVSRTSFDQNVSSDNNFSFKGSEAPQNATKVSSKVSVAHGSPLCAQEDLKGPTTATLKQEKCSIKDFALSSEAEVDHFISEAEEEVKQLCNEVQMGSEKERESINKSETPLGNHCSTQQKCKVAVNVSCKEEERVGKRKQYANEWEDHGETNYEMKKTKLSSTKGMDEYEQYDGNTSRNMYSSDCKSKTVVDIPVAKHESDTSDQDLKCRLTAAKNETLGKLTWINRNSSVESGEKILTGTKNELKGSEMTSENDSEEFTVKRSTIARKRPTYIGSESETDDSENIFSTKRKRFARIESDSENDFDNLESIQRTTTPKKSRMESELHFDRGRDVSHEKKLPSDSTPDGNKLTKGKLCSVVLKVLPKDVIDASLGNTSQVVDGIEKGNDVLSILSSDDEIFMKSPLSISESSEYVKTSTPKPEIIHKSTSKQELFKGCSSQVKKSTPKQEVRQEEFKNALKVEESRKTVPEVEESKKSVPEQEISKPTPKHEEKESLRHKKKKVITISDQASEVSEFEQEGVDDLQCEQSLDDESRKQLQGKKMESRSVCHNIRSRSMDETDVTNERDTSDNRSELLPVSEMKEKGSMELIPVRDIKKEPEEKLSREVEASHEDDDDVEIMYSQTNETIYISSDDEELIPNLSELDRDTPTPGSPELSIEDIFEKESCFTEVKNEKEEEDEDQWFPVLSQAFMDEMYGNEGTADEDMQERDRIEEDQPKPGVSGISSKKNEFNFDFGDISDEELWDPGVKSSEKKEKPNKTANLENLAEKFKKKYEPRKSKLTEPKLPPPRTKNDTIRVRRRSHEKTEKKTEDEKGKEKGNSVSRKEIPKVTSGASRRVSPALPETSKKSTNSRKGCGDLRKNLARTFNLESYQTSVAQKSREKHHLCSEENTKKVEAAKQGNSKSESDNLAQDILKASAKNNISIQKSSKETKDSSESQKKKMTGVAKVTVKTRSHSLTVVDLFAPPAKPPAQRHRIPKKNPASRKKGIASPQTTTPLVERASAQPVKKTLPTQPPEVKVTTENDIQPKSKKKVHFPPDNDLVEVRPISPRPERLANPNLPRKMKELYRRPVEGLPLELCLFSFVSKVCSWNYDWLSKYCASKVEYEKKGKSHPVKPPPVNGVNPVYPTLILYDSYQDYRDIFSNLLFYEMWESLYSDWIQKGAANGWLSSQVDAIRFFDYEISGQKHRLWSCRLCILCTHDMLKESPRIGCLIVLKKRMNNNAKGKNLNVMGYIDSCEKRPARNLTKELLSTCKDATVCLIATALIAKPAIMEFNLGDLVLVKNISYIRPCLRNYEGLCMLQASPLCSHILSPALYVFSCDGVIPDFVSSRISLNESQKRAIVEVSSKCLVNPHIPKISLIQGPPGTGKTRTIAGLVVQIIEACRSQSLPNCRILLCAPSNTAVDEVTLRLLKLREVGINLRLVRTGLSASVGAEVKDCTLDQLVEKNALREVDNKSVQIEIERKKKMVSEAAELVLKKHKEGAPKQEMRVCEARLNELVRHQRELERQVEALPSSHSHDWVQRKQKWTHQVLLNAEVITTTLTSCVSGAMAEVFSINSPVFTCCIIDEAGQCKETDTWLPLLLKVRKMVLVGDHKQLPATVLSQLAQNKRLHQSLFERLHHHLSVEEQRSDMTHLLNVQYRMHPEIVQWPSQHFYSNTLQTFPAIIQQRSYAIKPYIVYDLQDSMEQQFASGELCNPDEVCLVVNILEALTSKKYVNGLKIAVITPYQCQRRDLEKMTNRFKPQYDISVSTVDSCQGKEKDVVILSFVRANASGNIGFVAHRQRLNVALTRARMSCFLIANLRSFERNEDWAALIANARERQSVVELKKSNASDINFLLKTLQK